MPLHPRSVVGVLTLLALVLAPAAGAASVPRQLLDFGWAFQLSNAADPSALESGGGVSQTVDLPHDWSIAGPIAQSNPMGGAGGFFPAGVGWYRRELDVPAEWAGKRLFLQFEGVYMNADVYVDGRKVATHPYGYTPIWCELNVGPGRHMLAVRVDNGQHPNSRWYSGSGIYRHVWLHVKDPVHVAMEGGVYVKSSLDGAKAVLTIQTTVRNGGNAARRVEVGQQLTAPGGGRLDLPADRSRQAVDVPAQGQLVVNQTFEVPAPLLWSPESPNLYRLVTTVSDGPQTVDAVETNVGIRTVSVSAERGFELNGKRVKLNGGCVHHDNGGLGAMAFDRAEERRVELLKAAGYNAIRTAHNPPSTAFLDACDRLGMLVMDEAFDCWEQGKSRFDYAVAFREWWQRDVDAMVLRDRHHPSVVMWSIGNEIPGAGREAGHRAGGALADRIRTLDDRPITAGIARWNLANNSWDSVNPLFDKLDVAGINYDQGTYADQHRRFPQRPIISTETYPRDVFIHWALVEDNPYILGEFVWTALDYLGEAGIGRNYPPGEREIPHGNNRQFPYHAANCGDLDLTGFRKPVSHYRNIVWDRGEKLYVAVQEPTADGRPWVRTGWSVTPMQASWTWPGQEGKTLQVEVYSRCEQVRLYLNDTLIGERPTTRQQQFKATFPVPYAPGVLRAVGLEGGREVQRMELATAGAPAGLRLTADRRELWADGQDLAFLTIEAIDAQGRFQSQGQQMVAFEVTGAGTLAGVASGDYSRPESYQAPQRQLFQGRAQMIVRTGRTPGTITVKAQAPGLAGASVTLETRARP
jgi:beta-galactosidase